MVIGINLIAAIFFSLLSHPLHMSFTNIEYNESTQGWDLSVKLFHDDFGDELKRLYNLESILEDSVSQIESDVYGKYLSDVFSLKFDDVDIDIDNWTFEGKKLNHEAIWLNYSFYHDELPEKIRIKNKLMFGLFQDQKNLLIFTYKGKQKAYQFRHNKPEIEFEID